MTPNPIENPPCIAIETSGRLGSVAVGRGATMLHVARFSADLKHAVELLPTIDRLCRAAGLAPAEVAHCYVSGGPGSFTGVRLGVTVARILALAGDVRVVRVPTLEVIAQNALAVDVDSGFDGPPDVVGVLLDAKRNRVFTAAYARQADRYAQTIDSAERDAADFFRMVPSTACLLGDGVSYCGPAVEQSGLRVLPEHLHRARAEVVYQLAHARAIKDDFDDPRHLIPIYVRRPEAEEVWEQRQQVG